MISFNQMTEKSKTRPKTQTRRKELVEIAYRLIAEKGLGGLRTRDVAEAAGIDTGTLHYHFPSKEALEQAVVEHLVNDFRANRVESGAPPANALEELRNEILDAAVRVRQSPDQFVVMLDLTVRAFRDPAVAQLLGGMYEGWNWLLSGILTRGMEQGLFRTDIATAATATLIRAELIGLGIVGLGAPDRVEGAATVLYSQLETWLSKPK